MFSDGHLRKLFLLIKKVKYIENPLPVPKRREHKEMSYAINELTSENDDYDVKDMTGMDFFDIE